MTQSEDISEFTTTYAVPLHCDSCESSVRNALQLNGISQVQVDLKSQLVSVTGTVPPSQIVKAIQETGKDAIVRGAGLPDSAAVCILESHLAQDRSAPVKGLVRIVSISPSKVLLDVTLSGLVSKGVYNASIRSSGDISKGALSTGKELWSLGQVDVSEHDSTNTTFAGQTFLTKSIKISDVIGRSITVSKGSELSDTSLVGVIARSAGVWQNDKTVCSCSGKTIWEERKDAKTKGTL